MISVDLAGASDRPVETQSARPFQPVPPTEWRTRFVSIRSRPRVGTTFGRHLWERAPRGISPCSGSGGALVGAVGLVIAYFATLVTRRPGAKRGFTWAFRADFKLPAQFG